MALLAGVPRSWLITFGLTRDASDHIKLRDTSTHLAGGILQPWIFLEFPCDKSEIRLKPTQANFSVTDIAQAFENTINLQLRRLFFIQIVRCPVHESSDLLSPQGVRIIALKAPEALDDYFLHVFADFCYHRPDPCASL